MVFHAEENIILHQLFESKEDSIFRLRKVHKRPFLYSENIVFHTEENIILDQLFESKKDRISHLQKVQTKNFPII